MTLRESERRREQSRQAKQQQPHRSQRVYTFRQWCDLNGFSTATGRRILAAGKCKYMQLSERRIGIGEDDNADFQAACRGGA
jgi:hypothetical protein